MMNYACAALKRLPMCCTSRKQVARRKPQNNPTVLQSSLADGLYANEVGSQVNFGRTLPIFRMNELTRREAQNAIENLFHRNVARQRSSFKLWRLWIWSRVWRLGMTVVMFKWLLDNSQEQQVEQATASGQVRHSSNRTDFHWNDSDDSAPLNLVETAQMCHCSHLLSWLVNKIIQVRVSYCIQRK